jgi:hypothetical protein
MASIANPYKIRKLAPCAHPYLYAKEAERLAPHTPRHPEMGDDVCALTMCRDFHGDVPRNGEISRIYNPPITGTF